MLVIFLTDVGLDVSSSICCQNRRYCFECCHQPFHNKQHIYFVSILVFGIILSCMKQLVCILQLPFWSKIFYSNVAMQIHLFDFRVVTNIIYITAQSLFTVQPSYLTNKSNDCSSGILAIISGFLLSFCCSFGIQRYEYQPFSFQFFESSLARTSYFRTLRLRFLFSVSVVWTVVSCL